MIPHILAPLSRLCVNPSLMEILKFLRSQPARPTQPPATACSESCGLCGLCGLCRLCRLRLSWQLSGPESPPGFVSCLDSDWRRSGAGPDLGLGSPADVSRSPSSSPTSRNRAVAGSQERETTELHVPAFPRSLFP